MTSKVTHVPAPWNGMKSEAYSFACVSRASAALPSSTYDPLERGSSYADPEITGHFAGGMGTLMIVRYSDTPCGPYDELLLIPGKFTVPVRADQGARKRITRIYVSTAASTYSGRRNWNIPKRVAEFNFVPRTDGYAGYERIEVRLPGADKPFFAVTLTPSWLSFLKVPFSSWYMPDGDLVQPPLPQGDEPERVGTDEWQRVVPYMRGNCAVVYATGALDNGEWSDGVDMPSLTHFYSMGLFSEDFRMDFPEATEPTV